ncbi:multiple monosaccharide ABC transporter permease [Streptococcus thoraltensis]|uniref:multiple monosaccharide ABC transporter permease n=1 Tax=Streptococcus thoraltensis TaxID=55085 RepID=UPI001F569C20|nr:multiple monosaccharide ABC transporter permease [Streptococcus thoraltensis]MDY4761636.1 multiple monosaccharide ABC transporter permease [Streptococcus thoraltensis]
MTSQNNKTSENTAEYKTFFNSFLSGSRQYGIVGALIVIIAIFQFLTGGLLLQPNTVVQLIQQNAYVIILAVGMVMVIIATHIDLSVGSLVGFIGGCIALLMQDMHLNWLLAIVVGILIGLIIGVWQGFWVAYVGIPGFITTLAGMLIFRGLATTMINASIPVNNASFNAIAANYLPNIFGFWGQFDALTVIMGILLTVLFAYHQFRNRKKAFNVGLDVEPLSATYMKIAASSIIILALTYLFALSGNNTQGGIPIMLVIVGILVAVYHFILTKTVFGRHVYAVGGNRRAAMLSGINTKKVDFLLYVHMGFLSAVAAIAILSRLSSASAATGNSFEMDAIASCFVGGTAVTGGVGTIPGVVIGAAVIGVINQGLSIMGVDSALIQTIKGLVLLLAVAVDIYSKKSK